MICLWFLLAMVARSATCAVIDGRWPASGPSRSANGVVINETNEAFGTGVDSVEVRLPSSLSAGGKLFARLKATE